MKGLDEDLQVLAVCGVGMGTSLILRMNIEKVLSEMGVRAKVTNTDVSSARSERADVIVGQGMHTDEFAGAAPVVIAITNFMDLTGLSTQLRVAIDEQGWHVA